MCSYCQTFVFILPNIFVFILPNIFVLYCQTSLCSYCQTFVFILPNIFFSYYQTSLCSYYQTYLCSYCQTYFSKKKHLRLFQQRKPDLNVMYEKKMLNNRICRYQQSNVRTGKKMAKQVLYSVFSTYIL